MKITDPHRIYINDYNYNLPDDRIAKYPLESRDESKLLVYRNGEITDSVFSSITEFLPGDSFMVFNNTRVIQARLYFRKATGALIEVFCLDPYFPHDYNLIFQSAGKCAWYCMVGNLKKWKSGKLLKEVMICGEKVLLEAERKGGAGDNHIIEFTWNSNEFTFADILESIGELPIPPYLNRDTEEKDKETYQTLYSKVPGSVAAPTAGLHFTDKEFAELEKKRILKEEVTLHVGAGTFKPVKSDTIAGHEMHAEFISVTKSFIEKLLHHNGHVIAVGTTSVRTLESLYYIGSALERDPDPETVCVEQWQPYEEHNDDVSKDKALSNILSYLERNSVDVLTADTRIIIIPGYDFKIVDVMVTNFHQPQSTLLLLVSAFVGGKWEFIYNHALTQGYRFLSYGDSSLLFR